MIIPPSIIYVPLPNCKGEEAEEEIKHWENAFILSCSLLFFSHFKTNHISSKMGPEYQVSHVAFLNLQKFAFYITHVR